MILASHTTSLSAQSTSPSQGPSASKAITRGLGWGGYIGLALLALLLLLWAWARYGVSVDRLQGEVYRILYVHVPSAFAGFACAFLLLGQSLYSLKNPDSYGILWGKALAEVGLLFTLLTLITGSLWGRPTWGVWWTWDARLTTTFILGLLYSGYLVLWSSMSPGRGQTRSCAILGMLIALDVPIIYKSVTWWRTLHQPPSLFSGNPGDASELMANEMRYLLYGCVICVLALAYWLAWLRVRGLKLQSQLRTGALETLM